MREEEKMNVIKLKKRLGMLVGAGLVATLFLVFCNLPAVAAAEKPFKLKFAYVHQTLLAPSICKICR